MARKEQYTHKKWPVIDGKGATEKIDVLFHSLLKPIEQAVILALPAIGNPVEAWHARAFEERANKPWRELTLEEVYQAVSREQPKTTPLFTEAVVSELRKLDGQVAPTPDARRIRP